MIRILFSIVLFSLLSVAGWSQENNHAGSANEHMNQQSFEELIKSLNGPSRDFWQKPEAIMNLIRPLKGKKILDLGCGAGYFTFRMIDSGAIVIAADIDERFLAYVDSVRVARDISPKKLQTRKVAPDDAMLSKREVDMVLIVNTFHHLENRVEYFKKLKTGLRSNGFVVVVDYQKKELPIGPPVNMKQSADDVIRDLKIAGFSFFKTEDKLLPYQYIVLAL